MQFIVTVEGASGGIDQQRDRVEEALREALEEQGEAERVQVAWLPMAYSNLS